MKNFLKNSNSTLTEFFSSCNILTSRWGVFLENCVNYWSDLKAHESPWYKKLFKVAFDTVDIITWNGNVFMFMLICALIIA